jgi:amyotrophic lateral sclerosis 2 protein
MSEAVTGAGSKSVSACKLETQKVWSHVAAIMSKSERFQRKYQSLSGSSSSLLSRRDSKDINYDQLNKILNLDHEKLTLYTYEQIHKYLLRAFDSPHHPLGTLLNELATVYTATYGGVRVHPLLLKHAVTELRSITTRIYEAMTVFFPALPRATDQCILKSNDDDDCGEE